MSKRDDLKAEIKTLDDKIQELYKEIRAIDALTKPEITVHEQSFYRGWITCEGAAGCDWKSEEYGHDIDVTDAAWSHAREAHDLQNHLGAVKYVEEPL